MRLLSIRTAVLVVLTILFLLGVGVFFVRYVQQGHLWAHHPTNRHYFTGGKIKTLGTVYDRAGRVLLQMTEDGLKYNENKTIRTALMHAVGDEDGNVATSALVAFRKRLTGWNRISGAYRFGSGQRNEQELILTLDADLCAKAYQELNGRKGAVGVYNYRTGEILCMVSSPSFDPQAPPADLDPEKYEGVFLNRFFSAAYTPGSIFKLVTAAAALEQLEEIATAEYLCQGRMEIGGEKVTCMTAHGKVTLKEALAYSCNIAFAHIALELGAERLQEYANQVGFNAALVVDDIKTAQGKFDVTKAGGADLAWAGIGQYTNTANPLNFMAFMGAIANKGVRVTPTILKNKGPLSILGGREKKQILAPETAAELAAMMRNNTLTSYGEENFKGLELAAKSGTAEVGGGKRPHAWFAGFLAREDYPLAFVVIIENGGVGSRTAAKVAANVLQYAVN